MSYLIDLLRDHRRLENRAHIVAPSPEKVRLAISSLRASFSEELAVEDIESLQKRVATSVRENTIERLTKRDLRAVCAVFLRPPYPPGRIVEIGSGVIAEVKRRQLRLAMLALFNTYLSEFALNDEDIARLGRQLRDLISSVSWRSQDNWASRAEKLALFDSKEGPARLAAIVLGSNTAPAVTLADGGLDTEVRARSRFVEASFQLGCLAVSGLAVEKLVAFQDCLIRWGCGDDGQMLFPRSLVPFATALLEPWSDREPDKRHQTLLIRTLERAGGGDPRTHPARWRPVQEYSPIAYDTILKWLTQASVLQFLDIVGRSMGDANSRRMWAYRRAFWTSYLVATDGPTIDKAWIAFGSDAAYLAKEAARATGDNSFAAFGRQNDKSSVHSALIMEIGDLLIVDWSHNAKYQVWQRHDKGRPELFKPSYPAGTLYGAPHQDSHVAPANYTWQKKMAKIIEGRTFYSEKPAWRPTHV
jgi:hypothetical protein